MAYNRELSQFASFVEVGVNNTIGITTSVGIGTTNPQHTLDVNGNINLPKGNYIRFDGQNRINCVTGGSQNLDLTQLLPATGISTVELNTGSSANILRIAAGVNVRGGLIEFRGGDVTIDPGILKFHSGTTGGQNVPPERMRIDAIGNIGIGTTNPGAPLTIQSDSTSHAIRILGRTSDNKSALVFYDNSQTNYYSYLQSGPSYLAFGIVNEVARFDSVGNFLVGAATSTGTTNQKLQVQSGAYISGSVGIGTTNPQYALDVVGDFAFGRQGVASKLWAKRPSDGVVSGWVGFGTTGTNDFYLVTQSGASNLILSSSSSGNIIFNTNINQQELARITSAGNVGIGTTNPQTRLHVLSTSPEGILLERTNDQNSIIEYKNTAGSMYAGLIPNALGWGVDTDLNVGASPIFLAQRTGEVLIGGGSSTGTVSQLLQVNTGGAYVSGNVGIGTTNPTSRLQVQGNVRISGVVTATSFFGDGSGLIGVSASKWTTTSAGIHTLVNVGIGTTNPSSILDVFGNVITIGDNSTASGVLSRRNTNSLLVFSGGSSAGVSSGANIELYGSTHASVPNRAFYDATIHQFRDVDASPTYVTISTDTSQFNNVVLIGTGTSTGTASQTLQVTGGAYFSGNVGIGSNANPQDLLHIEGSVTPTIRLRNSTVGSAVTPASSIIDFRGFNQENRVRIEAQDRRVNFNGGWLNIATANGSNVLVNALHIDNVQRVLVGTSTARSNLFNSTFSAQLQVEGTTTATSSILATRSSAGSDGAYLVLAHSRGVGVSSNAALVANDVYGSFSYQGNDGTEFIEAASITAFADGNVGINSMPGRIVFSTTPTGSPTPLERMRITSGGLVGIGVINPAARLDLSFGGDTPNPVLKVRRTNNDGSGTGNPEIGIDVSIPNTQNLSGPTYGIKVYANQNLGGEHYAGYFEAVGSAYTTGIGVYAKTTHTDTNGNGYQPAILADAYSIIGVTSTGYAVGLEARTNNYVNNENIRLTSSYTGSLNQFAIRLVRNNTDIGGLRSNSTSTSYRTSQTSGFNGVDANTLSFETGLLERARIDSSGRLLVGTSTARGNLYNSTVTSPLQVEGTTDNNNSVLITMNSAFATGPRLDFAKSRGAAVGSNTVVVADDNLGSISFQGSDGTEFVPAAYIQANVDGTPGANDMPGRLVFSTTAAGASSPTERMRITSDGTTLIDKTASSIGTAGTEIDAGAIWTTRSAATAMRVNRLTDDGTLVEFLQASVAEGTISVSGTTVSYNGAHLSRWSQLPGGAERTEILRGTVLSNIDEMCDWGEESNEQLNRMKVSDVEGDPNVSGVFQAWDDDDDTYTDDFYCAMTGDFIIRIAEGVTVQRGDLLMSAGDGTAKPQDDDIIRSKTVAKVTSTHVTCTYDDGSYCVPCVLMAC